jgi:hypothetical protein
MTVMIRWLAALLVLALLPATPASAQGDEAAFRTEMVGRLGKAMPGATFASVPEDPLALTVTGGPFSDARINLHRVYNYCRQASAADCEDEKARFASAISKEPPAATAGALRLIVRDQEYVDALTAAFDRAPPDKRVHVILQPLGGGLFAIMVADSPEALQMMTDKGLEELGLNRDQAWAIAWRQTEAVLPPLPTAGQIRGTAVLFEGHEFGGSLLIDLPGWARLAKEVGPDLFITVVSDRIVFVGVLPDGANLDSFKKTVEEDCRAQPRCISPYIFRFRNGRWAVAN